MQGFQKRDDHLDKLLLSVSSFGHSKLDIFFQSKSVLGSMKYIALAYIHRFALKIPPWLRNILFVRLMSCNFICDVNI